jgi:hypothetical protein
MNVEFSKDFADFLEDRLGKALCSLRDTNNDYRTLSDDLESLFNTPFESIDEYKQAISKIAEIIQSIRDTEKHYLFVSGMREFMFFESTLKSDEFIKHFSDIG